MIEDSVFYLSWGCIFLGVFFAFSSAVGVLRMPDFYTRMHAASVSDGIAMVLIIAGLILMHGLSLYSAKLLLLAIFMRVTAPTGSHALARAAMHVGLEPYFKDKKEK